MQTVAAQAAGEQHLVGQGLVDESPLMRMQVVLLADVAVETATLELQAAGQELGAKPGFLDFTLLAVGGEAEGSVEPVRQFGAKGKLHPTEVEPALQSAAMTVAFALVIAVDVVDAVGVLDVLAAFTVCVVAVGHGVDDGHGDDAQFFGLSGKRQGAGKSQQAGAVERRHDQESITL